VLVADVLPGLSFCFIEEDEIRGFHSVSFTRSKFITNNAIVKEKAMEDEHLQQHREKVINELAGSGLTRSAMETVAEVLEEIEMTCALNTSRSECDVENARW
jgi:GTP-sensing pleiotropic transcriptional regulator CodY